MKVSATTSARRIAALLLLAAAGSTHAFHSGGVAECDGCHTMHASRDGKTARDGLTQFQPGAHLLLGADPSSVCLYCHEAPGLGQTLPYAVSTAGRLTESGEPPQQLTPGGDFGWLRKTFTWRATPGGAVQTSLPERHGHNFLAADQGYLPSSSQAAAPGGTYPSASLGCQSCHDPHGQYRRLPGGTISTTGLPILASGSHAEDPEPVPGVGAVGVYRLLGGVGYQPRSLSGNLAFVNPPPAAVAPASYNRSEAATQTRVAYGQGMSEWCANCHPGILSGGRTQQMRGLAHPAGNGAVLTPAVAWNYVAYVRTGVLTNADPTRAYLSLVPFEEGTSDYATLKSHASRADAHLDGPGSTATVSCLTCHRAHASAFDGILRFQVGNAFMTVAGPGGVAEWPNPATFPAEAQGRSQAETQQAYYGRPATTFSAFQATLCNKCHAKD